MNQPPLETIKSLASKLSALLEEGSGATDAERDVATRKLERLLERHGLTPADLADEALHDVPFTATRPEFDILVQCACFICDAPGLTTLGPKRWSKKAHQITIIGITHAQAVDIDICFRHYRRELVERVASLEAEIKEKKTAIRMAPHAIIQKNRIFSSHAPAQAGKAPSSKKVWDLINAMKGLRENRWEKPAGNVETTLALEVEGSAA